MTEKEAIEKGFVKVSKFLNPSGGDDSEPTQTALTAIGKGGFGEITTSDQ